MSSVSREKLVAERRAKINVLKRRADATRQQHYDAMLSKTDEEIATFSGADAMIIDSQELPDDKTDEKHQPGNKIAIVQWRRDWLEGAKERTTDPKLKERCVAMLAKPDEELLEEDDSCFKEHNPRNGAEEQGPNDRNQDSEQGQDTKGNNDEQPNNNTSFETGHSRGQPGHVKNELSPSGIEGNGLKQAPFDSNEKPLVPFPGNAPDGNLKTVGWLGGWGTRYINMHGSKSAPTYRIEEYCYPPNTYVLVKWKIDGKEIKSWETRTCIRRLWKKLEKADQAIYNAALEAENRYRMAQGLGRLSSRSPSVGLIHDIVEQKRAESLNPVSSAQERVETPSQTANPTPADASIAQLFAMLPASGELIPMFNQFLNFMQSAQASTPAALHM
ncbi:hypothetical protein PspLS_11872 [Pyricularia sp. CBS 133598]|nr:hypothetical protein PspLS_11872 [Pyricularia sp. CBS 133598]